MGNTDIPNFPLADGQRRSGHVFISYKSEESDKAGAIKAYVENLGYPCWMAPDSLDREGTQDYSDDIYRAIRECRCLLFVLSPRSLGSYWVRKEVQYALAECRKPVIPFLVAPIPGAKRSEDGLFIALHLEKQILNEEGARNGTMNLAVLNRHLEAAFAEGRSGTAGKAPASGADSGGGAISSGPGASGLRDAWERWRSRAVFHLSRIRELKAVDPLHAEPTDLSPEARREELKLSSTEAALALMNILVSDEPAPEPDGFDPKEIRRTSLLELFLLVYENGDDFGPAVYEMAAPHASAGVPWAAFVAHARHYSPDGRTELKESDQAKARTLLEVAIRDPANPYALVRMGDCWMFGIGGDVSGTRALHLYLEALRMGCHDVLFRLTQLYRWAPFGIRKDLAKAEEYARQGADGGVARCHVLLGDMLRDRAWAAREEHNPDYTAAEEEYVKAYEGGYYNALGDLFTLCFIYGWKLTRPDFQDVDRLLQRASRARLTGSFDSFAGRVFWGLGETEANVDVAIDYALAGVRENSNYCGARLGELLVQKASEEEAETIDATAVVAFAERDADLLRTAETGKFLGVFRNKTFSAGVHSDFGKRRAPLSPFWQVLFETGDVPWECRDEALHSPFRFLEFLRDFPAKPDGNLDRVQRLWRAFGVLSDIRCVGEVQKLGLTEVFPSDSLRLGEAARRKACEILADVPKAFPPLAEELSHKIQAIQNLLESEDGSLTENEVESRTAEFERLLRRNATVNNRILHVAKILADLEYRLSHPFQAAALRLFRNAYLQKSNSRDGMEFGVLFFVLNARYRDSAKNGGVLFAARDALWNVIHRGNFDAVFPFLELCLFGCRIGDNVIPRDLDSIERIEPVLWELVETEKEQVADSGYREQCLQIAFAMAMIFLDRNLAAESGMENWGRASLYSIPKAMEWLSVVIELAGKPGWEDVAPELVRHALARAEELKGKGYVVVQSAIKNGDVQKRLAEIETWNEENGTQQRCIQELDRQVEDSDIVAAGFKNVLFDGHRFDFVVSNDDVAVLFAVFPPETDFKVGGGEGEETGDVPKKTQDCIGEDNTISPRLIDMMLQHEETLRRIEENAEIRLAVLAGGNTLQAIEGAWGEKLRDAGIELVSHESAMDYLRSVFPVPREEDGNDPATDGD